MGHFKMFSLLLFLAGSCHTQPVESNLIIPSTPSSPSLPTSSLTISPLAMAANCSQTRQGMFYTIKVIHKPLHDVFLLELITFEILAEERLRLMGFDNQLIIACFANIVNILILLFSTNESNYLENPFLEMKRVNLLSKTHRNDKSNLKPMTVLQE